jgi:hypothetical protein
VGGKAPHLALAHWTGAWVDRAQHWSMVFCELLALTVIVTAFTLRPRRREPTAARGVHSSAKVKPK